MILAHFHLVSLDITTHTHNHSFIFDRRKKNPSSSALQIKLSIANAAAYKESATEGREKKKKTTIYECCNTHVMRPAITNLQHTRVAKKSSRCDGGDGNSNNKNNINSIKK